MKKEEELRQRIAEITAPDEEAMWRCRAHWDSLAKPLGSLGRLEALLVQIAGIQGTERVRIKKKGLIVMCADNGVVAEGVTQTGQEVTAAVAANFLRGQTCTSIMCRRAGVDVFPIDIGMASEVPGMETKKLSRGTKNFAREPAMSREDAVRAIEVGIEQVRVLKEAGYELLASGEMGIGNTTTSSAMAAVFLSCPPSEITGRGAGLSGAGLARKIEVIEQALALHRPDPEDALDVLSKVGGYDIAGLCGVFLGGALYHVPIVMDGLISAVAALTAARLSGDCLPYIIASHKSREPAAERLLSALDKEAILTAQLSLGEGSGAVAIFPLLDFAAEIYDHMSCFDEMPFEAYEHLV